MNIVAKHSLTILDYYENLTGSYFRWLHPNIAALSNMDSTTDIIMKKILNIFVEGNDWVKSCHWGSRAEALYIGDTHPLYSKP